MGNRVLVVDDHKLIRQGISKILSSDGFEVVGEASSGFDAVDKVRELSPDAVLMDLYMPGPDGLAATRLIKREFPDVQVVILTVSEEEEDIIEAVQAGARGYIIKNADASTLIQQLRQVLSGGVAMSEDMTEKLVTGLSRNVRAVQKVEMGVGATLTEREREVLALVGQGASNKALASALCISENTVRAHVRSLMQKLNLDNRTQLAVFGVREGLVTQQRRQPDQV